MFADKAACLYFILLLRPHDFKISGINVTVVDTSPMSLIKKTEVIRVNIFKTPCELDDIITRTQYSDSRAPFTVKQFYIRHLIQSFSVKPSAILHVETACYFANLNWAGFEADQK